MASWQGFQTVGRCSALRQGLCLCCFSLGTLTKVTGRTWCPKNVRTWGSSYHPLIKPANSRAEGLPLLFWPTIVSSLLTRYPAYRKCSVNISDRNECLMVSACSGITGRNSMSSEMAKGLIIHFCDTCLEDRGALWRGLGDKDLVWKLGRAECALPKGTFSCPALSKTPMVL